jgi:hypothetical protein
MEASADDRNPDQCNWPILAGDGGGVRVVGLGGLKVGWGQPSDWACPVGSLHALPPAASPVRVG